MTKLTATVSEIQKMVVVYVGYTIVKIAGRAALQLGRAAFSR